MKVPEPPYTGRSELQPLPTIRRKVRWSTEDVAYAKCHWVIEPPAHHRARRNLTSTASDAIIGLCVEHAWEFFE